MSSHSSTGEDYALERDTESKEREREEEEEEKWLCIPPALGSLATRYTDVALLGSSLVICLEVVLCCYMAWFVCVCVGLCVLVLLFLHRWSYGFCHYLKIASADICR